MYSLSQPQSIQKQGWSGGIAGIDDIRREDQKQKRESSGRLMKSGVNNSCMVTVLLLDHRGFGLVLTSLNCWAYTWSYSDCKHLPGDSLDSEAGLWLHALIHTFLLTVCQPCSHFCCIYPSEVYRCVYICIVCALMQAY